MDKTRFSAESTLASLKDFQRKTVDYVFNRFYGHDPADRFLVATARARNATLVTADQRILDYSKLGHVKTLAT